MDLMYLLFEGGFVLCYDYVDFVVYDIGIFVCKGVEVDYDVIVVSGVWQWLSIMSEVDKQKLENNIVVGFFGGLVVQFCVVVVMVIESFFGFMVVDMCINLVVFLVEVILVV